LVAAGTPSLNCEKCGQVHPGCAAHKKNSDPIRPCRNQPKPGLRVCRYHGAGSPQSLAKSARFVARERAAKSLADVEVVPIENPIEALADATSTIAALVSHASDKVNELTSWRYSSDQNTEQLRAEVSVLLQLTEQLRKYLADWSRIGLDQMRIRIDAIKAQQWSGALERAFASAGTEPAVAQAIKDALGEELRKLGGHGG
jgi:hypothetical protein